MPTFIQVSEDDAVQYSPSQLAYYALHPKFDKKFHAYATYEPTKIAPKEEIVLKSTGVHHCHTVIVRDRTYNNYFMLHVSPQALRRPYNPVNKEVGTAVSTSGFGLFFMDSDIALTNVKKPAYIDLDPYYYNSELIGTHSNSELEVIVVANNEHWNIENVQEKILTTLQERIPGKLVKSNVIINEALNHAYYYSVAFNPESETLTVISNNGLYTESYENAFNNNINKYAHEKLPEEKQMKLKEKLRDLKTQSDKFLGKLLRAIDSREPLEYLVLNPSHDFIKFTQDNRIEIEELINGMESVISESKNPVLNLGSPALYDAYKNLGLLHLGARNYDKSAFYFSRAADYATSMSKAEFDEDKVFFSTLAGAAFERNGDLEKAYPYYKEATNSFLGYVNQADAQISFARIASQIKGNEVEALNVVIKAKRNLNTVIKQVEQGQPPEQQKILKILNLRITACDNLLHSLQNVLIEHRHEDDVLQHEYDKLFALSTVTL
ncbi:hypothetical protein ELY20_06895 [Legionella qingyii]|nr:hypothetical protein [Legionella qingyii]RUR23731.1 hypothetical protein ELY20_06895 [Legionella qingyii]RUR26313.1 hypothetical protein ELY16_07755 [Legionella qingyii]